jgi:hypothetical protein
VLESKAGAVPCVVDCLEGLLNDEEMNSENIEFTQSLAEVLSKDLLAQLTESSVLNAAGRIILAAAASIVKHDPATALLITFSVASRGIHYGEEEKEAKKETLFFSNSGTWCNLSTAEKQSLFSCCLVKVKNENCTQDFIAKLIVALRCVPFVISLSRENESEEDSKIYYKKTSKWALDVLTFLDSESSQDKPLYSKAKQELTIAKAIALEAVANLSLDHLNFSGTSSAIEKTVLRAKLIAESLLSSDGGSMWAVRGIAAFTRVMSKFNIVLENQLDQAFDALVPNLRSKSHSLRLHTLEILNSYPKKAFVTDHNDLDFHEDLDEDPSFQLQGDSEVKRGPVGLSDLINIMFRLESIPVKFGNERSLVAMISKIEVLGRTGRLPVVYAEAAVNHMLGTFYIKFAPIWPAATRCIVALLKGHEDTVWPAIEEKLLSVMESKPSQEEPINYSKFSGEILSFADHTTACLKWQDSYGLNVSIFGQSAEFSLEDDEVPSFHMADEETAMESVWGIAEKSQQTLAKNSRVIVPAFIRFLHNQYYPCHQNDPDAHELALHDYVAADEW